MRSTRNTANRSRRSPGGRGSRTRVASLVALAVLAVLGAPVPVTAGPAPAGPAGPATAGEKQSPAGHRVNVNTAGLEELQTLPRIGPALARRIVEYRRKAGPFRRPEDLLAVRGIGPKLLARLRGRITVGTAGSGRGGDGAP